jgi:hypothetical protein
MIRMIRKLVLVLTLAHAIALACSNGPERSVLQDRASAGSRADSTFLENAYVKVQRNTVSYGAAHAENIGTRLIVALTNVMITSNRGTQKLGRGGIAAFKANESYNPPTGDYFEVAFKLDHPALKSPEEWIEPVKNKIVYEDEQIRAFEERLEGGGERPLHSHDQRVVVRLNEVQLTDPRFPRSERPGAGLQVPNTVRFAEPIVHVVKNLSKIPLFNIVIEFKIPHAK